MPQQFRALLLTPSVTALQKTVFSCHSLPPTEAHFTAVMSHDGHSVAQAVSCQVLTADGRVRS
jgi:hypothetical protein